MFTARQISIGPAQATEVRRLATIAYDAWSDGILPLIDAHPKLKMDEYLRFRTFCERNVSRIVVARHGDRPIAWAGRSTSRNYVAFLFVSPEFQSLGVGSRLLARVETLALLEGYDQLFLDCLSAHAVALKFYEHKGYVEQAPADMSLVQTYPTKRMAKSLALPERSAVEKLKNGKTL